jgi:hypothetical protein
MTILAVIFVAALATFLLMWKVVRGDRAPIDSLDELVGATHPVDLEAFRNLVSRDEERYLRAHLLPEDYRQVQRMRVRAALQYLGAAAHNAKILLRVGEGARHSSDPELAAAGEQLVTTAVAVRLRAIVAMTRLYPGLILPGMGSAGVEILPSYEQLKSSFSRLGAMANPVQASRVAAVL